MRNWFRLDRSYLALSQDPSIRILPWIVGFIVFLITVVLCLSLMVGRTVNSWQTGVEGQMTVQIPLDPDLSPAQITQVEAEVLEVLQNTSGIRDLEILEPEQTAALLGTWVDEAIPLDLLPLPTLIAVQIDEGVLDFPNLATNLQAINPTIIVDDHSQWTGDLNRLVWTLRAMALVAVLAICGILVLVVLYFTRVSLSVHRPVVETLHLVGATHDYIVGQFQTMVLALTGIGTVVGILVALLALYAVNAMLIAPSGGLIPPFTLGIGGFFILVIVALLVVGLSVATTRRYIVKILEKLG